MRNFNRFVKENRVTYTRHPIFIINMSYNGLGSIHEKANIKEKLIKKKKKR